MQALGDVKTSETAKERGGGSSQHTVWTTYTDGKRCLNLDSIQALTNGLGAAAAIGAGPRNRGKSATAESPQRYPTAVQATKILIVGRSAPHRVVSRDRSCANGLYA